MAGRTRGKGRAIAGAAAIAAALTVVGGGATSAAAPPPAVHYTFDGSLTDAQSGSTLTVAPACPAEPCNATTGFGSDPDGGYWTWTSTDTHGGGFTVDTNAAVGTSYTVALKFALSTKNPWRKIIDYANRTSDNGFYFHYQKLNFWTPTLQDESATEYPDDTVLDLVAVRQSTGGVNGTFAVYAVGADQVLTLLFSFDDTDGSSIPVDQGSGSRFGFFFDDTDTSDEAAPGGRVYDLRIWFDVALSPDDLNEELGLPAANVPAPVTPASSTALRFTG